MEKIKYLYLRFLCYIGLHKFDEEEWMETEDWDGRLYERNYCVRCGEVKEKKYD